MMMPPGGFPGMMPQGVAPAQAPMIVLNPGTQREQGHKAQIANIKATKVLFISANYSIFIDNIYIYRQ